MSSEREGTAAFEERLRALLGESAERVSARVRSRLNRARQAALVEADRRRSVRPWRSSWVPAAGALAAAALIALVLWPREPRMGFAAVEASHATVEDLGLLADQDGLDLMKNGDGQFYEWAMSQAQSDSGVQSSEHDGAHAKHIG